MSPNQNAHQVLVVIGGTLLLVLALSTLTDKLNGAASRFYSNVLLAVYKELTIIGVVALLLICLEEVAHPAPDLVHVFHVVHLSVLMVAAVHIGVASLVATSRKRCEREWKGVEDLDTQHWPAVRKLRDETAAQLGVPKRWEDAEPSFAHWAHELWLSVRWPSVFATYRTAVQHTRYHDLRWHFLHANHLPKTFQLYHYLKLAHRHVLLEIVEAREDAWLGLVGAVAAALCVQASTDFWQGRAAAVYLGATYTACAFVVGVVVLLSGHTDNAYWHLLHSPLLDWDVAAEGRCADDAHGERQRAFFFLGSAELVVDLLQMVSFALSLGAMFALHAATHAVSWQGILSAAVALFTAAAVVTLFVPRITSRYALTTSTGEMVDTRLLLEAFESQQRRAAVFGHLPDVSGDLDRIGSNPQDWHLPPQLLTEAKLRASELQHRGARRHAPGTLEHDHHFHSATTTGGRFENSTLLAILYALVCGGRAPDLRTAAAAGGAVSRALLATEVVLLALMLGEIAHAWRQPTARRSLTASKALLADALCVATCGVVLWCAEAAPADERGERHALHLATALFMVPRLVRPYLMLPAKEFEDKDDGAEAEPPPTVEAVLTCGMRRSSSFAGLVLDKERVDSGAPAELEDVDWDAEESDGDDDDGLSDGDSIADDEQVESILHHVLLRGRLRARYAHHSFHQAQVEQWHTVDAVLTRTELTLLHPGSEGTDEAGQDVVLPTLPHESVWSLHTITTFQKSAGGGLAIRTPSDGLHLEAADGDDGKLPTRRPSEDLGKWRDTIESALDSLDETLEQAETEHHQHHRRRRTIGGGLQRGRSASNLGGSARNLGGSTTRLSSSREGGSLNIGSSTKSLF